MNVFTAIKEAYVGVKYQGGALSAGDQKKAYDNAKGPGHTPAPAPANGSVGLGAVHNDRQLDSIISDPNGAWSVGSSEGVSHGNHVMPNPYRR